MPLQHTYYTSSMALRFSVTQEKGYLASCFQAIIEINKRCLQIDGIELRGQQRYGVVDAKIICYCWDFNTELLSVKLLLYSIDQQAQALYSVYSGAKYNV